MQDRRAKVIWKLTIKVTLQSLVHPDKYVFVCWKVCTFTGLLASQLICFIPHLSITKLMLTQGVTDDRTGSHGCAK